MDVLPVALVCDMAVCSFASGTWEEEEMEAEGET